MFTTDPRDLARSLGEMEKYARERSHFDQIEARQRFNEFLANDRRFDSFDKDRLIERVMEARSCGRVLDLGDPWLKAGGVKRPGAW